ncbi:MAG: hypothetical protein AAGB34_00685 [Planctomycetota bacterium]
MVLACTGFRNRGIAAMTAVIVFMAMCGAGVASSAGQAAYQRAATESRPYLSTYEIDAMNAHERLGEGAWLYFVPTLLLSGSLAFVWKKGWMRVSLGLLGIVASLFLVVWIGRLGHTGGALVYDHGIGTPPRIPAGK